MKEESNKLIYHIPNELFAPSAYKLLEGLFEIKTIKGLFDSYHLKGPISYKISITNTGDAFLFAGTATAEAITACSRCLEEMDINLQASVDAFYLIEKPDNYKDEEINEFEILPEDHNIDLGEIIIATLIVDAPEKPLCDEDCKGLCSQCGTNLNLEPCNCSNSNPKNSAFDVLKDFKVES